MQRWISFAFLLVFALTWGVFHLKYIVTDLECDLRTVKKNIREHQESIHVLNAEWEHLSNPKRIDALARQYLPLTAMRTEQVVNLNQAIATLQRIVPLPSPNESQPNIPQPLPLINTKPNTNKKDSTKEKVQPKPTPSQKDAIDAVLDKIAYRNYPAHSYHDTLYIADYRRDGGNYVL